MCVLNSIIGPVGDGGLCGHKPTWNFLNKGLIFTGSCTVPEEFLSPMVVVFFPLFNQRNRTLTGVIHSDLAFTLFCVVEFSDLELIYSKRQPCMFLSLWPIFVDI